MKTICPCCKSEIDTTSQWPLVDLNSNGMAWKGAITHVPAITAELMTALIAAHPRYASIDHLISQVWGEADAKIDAVANLRVQISILRRILKPLGFSVDVIYDKGWRLEKLANIKHKKIGVVQRRRLANAK